MLARGLLEVHHDRRVRVHLGQHVGVQALQGADVLHARIDRCDWVRVAQARLQVRVQVGVLS